MSKIFKKFIKIFLLWSCNSSEMKNINDGTNEIEISTKTIQEANESLNNIDQKINILRTKEPIKSEDITKVFPIKILDFQRGKYTSQQSYNAMNFVFGDATYLNKEKTINITITDGAGETGSAMVSIIMLALHSNVNKRNAQGFEETGVLNGKRAIFKEEILQGNNKQKLYSIQYITRDRYAISISSKQVDLNELKKFNQHLKLDQLP